EVEINRLKERVKNLKDKEGVIGDKSRDDASINGRSSNEREAAAEGEEIQGMIDSLDKSNETVAKYLQEYQQSASDLSLEKKIELISDLVKYQDHYKKVYKFQSQQRKPMSKKQKREYYMAVIKSYLGWRFKDFKVVYVQALQVKHPIIDWKVHSEGETNYWQIIRLGGSTACYQFFVDLLRQLD
nr:hypothetical protein [Tanacetum cinerariifolium]